MIKKYLVRLHEGDRQYERLIQEIKEVLCLCHIFPTEVRLTAEKEAVYRCRGAALHVKDVINNLAKLNDADHQNFYGHAVELFREMGPACLSGEQILSNESLKHLKPALEKVFGEGGENKIVSMRQSV